MVSGLLAESGVDEMNMVALDNFTPHIETFETDRSWESNKGR